MDYGVKNDYEKKLITKFILENTIINLISVKNIKKNYIKISYKSKLDFNQLKTKIYLKLNVVFNLLTVILSLIKTLLEKIKNGSNRSKQNKYGFSNGI